jgi:NitT/TauT family transport system permease protein
VDSYGRQAKLTAIRGPRARARYIPDWLYPVAALFAGLVSWELVVRALAVPVLFLPPPTLVLAAAIKRFALLWHHGGVTLAEALIGIGLSCIVGIPIGIILASLPRVRGGALAVLGAANTVPKVAIAPLFVIPFGFGLIPSVLTAFLLAFFPITLSTVVGLLSTPDEMIYLARVTGAGYFQTLRMFRLRYALPNMFAGAKISQTLSLSGAVVGEFVAGQEGLGRVVLTSSQQNQSALTYAAIVGIVAIGLAMYSLISVAEKRVLAWHVSTHHRATTGWRKP